MLLFNSGRELFALALLIVPAEEQDQGFSMTGTRSHLLGVGIIVHTELGGFLVHFYRRFLVLAVLWGYRIPALCPQNPVILPHFYDYAKGYIITIIHVDRNGS